jgi:two-component system nitrogen regulation sensor histidine kinase NtrY
LQQTNSELNEALSQIDTIYRNVDSALILFDKDLTILKINEHAKSLMNADEKFQAAVLKLTTDFMMVTFSEQTQSFIFENTKDDARQYTATISKIYDSNSELENILLVIDDNTHLMNMQRVTLWKEVASRLAHEIKNPLTPIKLTAERVKRRSKDAGDADLQELIAKSMDMIVTESDELLTLVEEFSIYARMPSLIRDDMNLLAIAEEVVALQKRLNTEVAMNVDIAEDIVLKGDKHQLKRVFVNLIQNSIQAMEGREGSKIDIRAVMTAGKVEITVEDNGSGIKDEDIEKVFVPYFSKKPSGTGLGLAIIKKIIEEHGGTITVKSRVDEFTQFYITLPMLR